MAEEYFAGDKGETGVIIEQAIFTLIEGKGLTLEEQAQVTEQLHKPGGKDVFAETLQNITKPVQLPVDSFRTFGELVKCLLAAYVRKQYDHNILRVVLTTSKNIYAMVLLNTHNTPNR